MYLRLVYEDIDFLSIRLIASYLVLLKWYCWGKYVTEEEGKRNTRQHVIKYCNSARTISQCINEGEEQDFGRITKRHRLTSQGSDPYDPNTQGCQLRLGLKMCDLRQTFVQNLQLRSQ